MGGTSNGSVLPSTVSRVPVDDLFHEALILRVGCIDVWDTQCVCIEVDTMDGNPIMAACSASAILATVGDLVVGRDRRSAINQGLAVA